MKSSNIFFEDSHFYECFANNNVTGQYVTYFSYYIYRFFSCSLHMSGREIFQLNMHLKYIQSDHHKPCTILIRSCFLLTKSKKPFENI